MMKIKPHEKAVLVLYLIQIGVPPWAKDKPEKILAVLCDKSERWAKRAYTRAYHAGYVSKIS